MRRVDKGVGVDVPDSVKAALFDRLIDDASVFPPARLDMRRALRAHERNRSSAYARLQGAFVVPASRFEELRAERAADVALRVNVVLDDAAALESLEPDAANIAIDALEIPPGARIPDIAALAARWGGAPLALWVEVPFDAAWTAAADDTLASLVAARAAAPANVRAGANVRCGGLSATIVPEPEDLGAFIVAANAQGVPWKATAGLHQAVRHADAATGFPMHGFLNVQIAAYAHHSGAADRDAVVEILAEDDARAFSIDPAHAAWRGISLDAAAVAAARAATFSSFGSSSFFEPVNALRTLGMLM